MGGGVELAQGFFVGEEEPEAALTLQASRTYLHYWVSTVQAACTR